MTRELLNKVVKAKRIDLNLYDSVMAYVNDAYTKVYITFGCSEVLGGHKRMYCQNTVALSVSAILKRCEEWPEDYATKGNRWLWEIR